MLLATHSIHFRVHTRVLLTLLVACAIATAMWAQPSAPALLRDANAALKAGDRPLALEKLAAARDLLPDYPRLHLQLARLHATSGDHAAALAALSALADLGVASDIAHDAALAPLHASPAWADAVARFTANAAPRGHADRVVTLPARDGIVETAVADSHGRWFLADVRNRRLDVREPDGSMRHFSSERDGLAGVFSLALDEAHQRLWAGISATPEIKDYRAEDSTSAFFAEYNLTTGKLARVIRLPADERPHVLGSLTFASDGTLFATDSGTPCLWRANPADGSVERWLASDDFASLQGLAFSADGKTLYVADYARGLWAIDVATKTPRRLRAPAHATLFGIDDLRLASAGALVAVQNGIEPQRVIRLDLDAAGEISAMRVLASALPGLDDLAGGSLRDGRYVVVGNAGWSLFDSPGAAPAARDVQLFSVTP
ncbi:MAG: SMP-30/gluconolactonase/LRE family protein [Candidatus Didemnitutus sp.]|nr:SMP-30/gluconolactonase/LRE family protein [Candidatus Didemnitutus sp.]